MPIVALFAYAWDVAQGGHTKLFDLAAEAGINRIYLTTVYHAGFFLQPHHHFARVYMVEDGVGYFQPTPDLYRDSRLKPLVSSLCRQGDLLAFSSEEAERRGLELSAWHVCLHNTPLGISFPDCTVQNVFGDPYYHALSPGHPDARIYVLNVLRDLSRYRLRSVLLEACDYRGRAHGANWVSGHHHERSGIYLRPLEEYLLSLSFNPEDVHAAAEAGVDMKLLRQDVRGHLERYFSESPEIPPDLPDTVEAFRLRSPALELYESYRTHTVRQLISELKTTVSPHGIELDGPADPSINTAVIGVYGRSPYEIGDMVQTTRRKLQPDQKILVTFRMGFNSPGFGPAILSKNGMEQYVQTAVEHGAAGVAFYNYAEAPSRYLDWMGASIRRCFSHQTQPKHIRVGLIGCGGAAAMHVEAYASIPAVRLIACTDVDAQKARAWSEDFQIPAVCETPEQLLARDDIDLVSIALPARFRRAVFLSALRARKNVWIENPPGIDLAEAEEMLSKWQECALTAAVGLHTRYTPAYQFLRGVIARGSVGKPLCTRMFSGNQKDWRKTIDAEDHEETLLSSTIHLLSPLLWVLGDVSISKVAARLRKVLPMDSSGQEDDVWLQLESPDAGVIEVTNSVAHHGWSIDIVGSLGRIGAYGDWRKPEVRGELTESPDPSRFPFLQGRFSVSWEQIADLVAPGTQGLASDLVSGLRSGRRHPRLPDLLHARNLMAILSVARRSSGEGQPADIEWAR